MNETNMQAMLDGLSRQLQRERAKTQMTLGQMIKVLVGMSEDAEVANLHSAHSYRGYYEDLAFEQGEGTRPIIDLLAECYDAMGEVFEGYKGGDFAMTAVTPVWVADYGACGQKLLALHPDGGIETAEDE